MKGVHETLPNNEETPIKAKIKGENEKNTCYYEN